MINSYKNKSALLIGNGINQLDSTQSVSWGELLNELKDQYGIDVDLDNEFKPFPIGFEEMHHLKKGGNSLNSKLKNLKTTIREIIDQQMIGKRGFNDYHKRIMEVGYHDVLTTNYDYSLQKSVSDDFILNKNKYARNKLEIKHSLRRKYVLPNIKSALWHIHGELVSSRKISDNSKNYAEESIMIGYEHYSEYLERIQENINGKRGKRTSHNQSIISRLRFDNTGDFWTDIFFTHNLDIIGLGLDFSENHLWWILNKRASLIRNNRRSNSNREDEVDINNEINYYYPVLENENIIDFNNFDINRLIKKKNSFNKSKAIADVLKSFKVNPISIQCLDYKDFYDEFIIDKVNGLGGNETNDSYTIF